MVNSYIAVSLFLAVAFIALGLVVYLRNYKSSLHRNFFIFSVALAGWLVTNYVAGSGEFSPGASLTANRAVFFFSSGTLFSLLLFIKSLTARRFGWLEKILVMLHGAILVSSATSLYVAGVFLEDGTYQINFGPAAEIYFLILLLTVIVVIYDLVLARRSAENKLASQIDILFWSFGLGLAGVLTTNALLPFLFDYFLLTDAGSLFSVFFIAGLAYTIIRHRLFDLRLIFAKTLTYLLSIGIIATIYALVTYALRGALLDIAENENIEQLIYVVTLVIAAVSFGSFKAYFDKISNRIFYRDAYDPQEFLDELNKVLVAKVDVEPLLNDTVSIIKAHLKSSFVAFHIRETQYINTRLIGDNGKKLEEGELKQIGKLVAHVHKSVVLTDELEREDTELKELLQAHDIAAVARLVTTVEYDIEGVGFLMFGEKKSGSPYGRQDIKMIEIIANELVIAVQNALRFEEIEEFNVTLQQKVDDATKKLRKTNEKLKEMDETKDEFISMASHQLRTPLTSVKGYLSMVLEGDAGEIKPMQEKLLSQAFTSSQRMVYLIADLLNVSRLRTGKFIIEPIRANLADMVEGEVRQLKETASSRGLELIYEKPTDFPDLMVDETKVRQVIMNFIDNAIYYTPSEGKITVELTDKEDSVDFTVTDTGMGVPKSDQQHLFTKFYRAGNARKARPDGTGLGLFMAKKVIVEQGGAVIFKSKEGEGSTFGFTFPKDKLRPQEIEKPADKNTEK